MMKKCVLREKIKQRQETSNKNITKKKQGEIKND